MIAYIIKNQNFANILLCVYFDPVGYNDNYFGIQG